jgi:hypothetical protein
VLNTLFHDGDGKVTRHKKHEKFVTLLRKVLGVKKLGKYNKDKMMPLFKRDVDIVPIGIKKDYYQNGQEML